MQRDRLDRSDAFDTGRAVRELYPNGTGDRRAVPVPCPDCDRMSCMGCPVVAGDKLCFWDGCGNLRMPGSVFCATCEERARKDDEAMIAAARAREAERRAKRDHQDDVIDGIISRAMVSALRRERRRRNWRTVADLALAVGFVFAAWLCVSAVLLAER